MADPIADVVSALSILVTPNPVLNSGSPQAPSAWASGGATEASAFTPIQTLLGVLFSASSDMTTVGKSVNSALTSVANVVTQLANALATVSAAAGDVTSAMKGLQQALTMAQSLAPSSVSVVLTSGSQLFLQLQGLLTATGDVKLAAAELGELSQLLSTLAGLFPS